MCIRKMYSRKVMYIKTITDDDLSWEFKGGCESLQSKVFDDVQTTQEKSRLYITKPEEINKDGSHQSIY